MLDEVVQARNDNKGFRMQIEGHASSEGAYDRNQTLSEKRADTVLEYLVIDGIDRRRKAAAAPLISARLHPPQLTSTNRRVRASLPA